MKIAHLLGSTYIGLIELYFGSIAQITAELVYGQRRLGHTVDTLTEKDFLRKKEPWGDPYPDKLKEYDIVVCHETVWLDFMDEMGIKYVHVMHDGNTLINKNHISPTQYWNNINGGKAKVVPFGVTPERFTYSEEKEDKFIYINTLCPKKGIHEILDNIGDHSLEIFGGNYEENYNRMITDKSNKLSNVEFHDRWINNEEKYKVLPKRKGMLLAHIESKGPESFCITQLEAMFSGTPVVAYGNIFREVSEHGVSALVCNSWGDYRHYLNDVTSIKSKDCFDYGMEFYTADKMNNKHLELYQRVIDRENW